METGTSCASGHFSDLSEPRISLPNANAFVFVNEVRETLGPHHHHQIQNINWIKIYFQHTEIMHESYTNSLSPGMDVMQRHNSSSSKPGLGGPVKGLPLTPVSRPGTLVP